MKNEHQSYVNQQEELVRLANKAAFKLKEQADHDYQVADQKLQQEIERGDTFRRCVAAGKCGALVIRVPTNPGQTGTVTSSCSNDGTGPNSIPVGSNTTETQIQTPPIVEECAVTTLRLNQLQSFIESQTDY